VLAVTPESDRASRLSLSPPHWPGHLPGQHLDVRLTAEDGYTAQRSYSIASAPEQPGIDLVVEELPDGEVSPYLTRELRSGDELEVRGPVGGWFVWPDSLSGPVQLIAGGSGVAPFLAMLDHHRLSGSAVPAQLLYSVRSQADVLGKDRLAATSVPVTYALTREVPAGWTGVSGRVDRDVLRTHTLPPGAAPQVFVCGPTGFVEVVTQELIALGHPAAQVKTERFGASGGTT
jgi:ferredoxin-NADP reductase